MKFSTVLSLKEKAKEKVKKFKIKDKKFKFKLYQLSKLSRLVHT